MDDPDPVEPLVNELTDGLRAELKDRVEQLGGAQSSAVQDLEAWADWGLLDPDDRQALLSEAKLDSSPAPDISTDAKLLQVLDAKPLSAWRDQIDFVPSRRDHARQRAAKLLQPESVSIRPPSATLKTPGDLDAYLAGLREQVLPHLEADKTVVI